MMKQRKERFALETLDEQFEQLTEAQETENAPPEQHMLQNLHALHATRAEHERQILERVRLRLAISGGESQSRREEEAFLPEPERPPILLPSVKRQPRFGPFFQSAAAILFVSLLMGSFLLLFRHPQPGTTTSGLTTSWQVVSSPHLPAEENHLWSVSASAQNDAWAVGESFDGSHRKTLIEHWNGQHWKVVANLNPGSNPSLEGVAAIAPDNAWAVGETSSAQNNTVSIILIEHWDGSAWKVIQAPNPGSGGSFLSGVVAVAANNVWAIGATIDAGVEKALIEHWDGEKWKVVSSPSPASVPTYLTGVTAISATDIWAVGYLMPSQSSRRALIEHWDGKLWRIIEDQGLKTVDSQLFSVSAVSSDDVWAVGTLETGAAKPLIEHWDGKQWRTSPLPNGLENSFSSVIAINAQDVWAVGSTNNTNGPPTLFVHWDGRQWHPVQAASASSQCQNELTDITVIPQSSRLWAVGDYIASSCSQSSLLVQPLFELSTP